MGDPPAGHIDGSATCMNSMQPHWAFISTASSALFTWAQSAGVMPATPIWSEHDWLSALKLSRKLDEVVRYVLSARYWTLVAFVRPMPAIV